MVTYRIMGHVGNGMQCKIQKSGSLLGWQDVFDPYTGYMLWFTGVEDARDWLISRGVSSDRITHHEVMNA